MSCILLFVCTMAFVVKWHLRLRVGDIEKSVKKWLRKMVVFAPGVGPLTIEFPSLDENDGPLRLSGKMAP